MRRERERERQRKRKRKRQRKRERDRQTKNEDCLCLVCLCVCVCVYVYVCVRACQCVHVRVCGSAGRRLRFAQMSLDSVSEGDGGEKGCRWRLPTDSYAFFTQRWLSGLVGRSCRFFCSQQTAPPTLLKGKAVVTHGAGRRFVKSRSLFMLEINTFSKFLGTATDMLSGGMWLLLQA